MNSSHEKKEFLSAPQSWFRYWILLTLHKQLVKYSTFLMEQDERQRAYIRRSEDLASLGLHMPIDVD
jgi:hypothetical protein